jgi:hypothetical protein
MVGICWAGKVRRSLWSEPQLGFGVAGEAQLAAVVVARAGRFICTAANFSRTLRAVSPGLNQCSRVGTDRDGAVSCGSKMLLWTAGLRKQRSLPNGASVAL